MPDVAQMSSSPARLAGEVLELRVHNHPGVMSHITGLFARRAFNLDAIVCVPCTEDGGTTSVMWLAVAREARLEQVEEQLRKLHDVLEVSRRPDLSAALLAQEVALALRRVR